MSDLIPFIVSGLTTGAVYGLAGLGLVMTYKTSGVFNFAHGALATVAAYVFYELHVKHDLSWPVAVAIVVLVVGPVMGLIMELLARRLQPAGLALQVAGTIGLLLAIAAAAELHYGSIETRIVPVFLSQGSVTIQDVPVQWADIITFLFACAVTLALSLFFRLSPSGAEMRAVVDDPDLLALSGTSPVRTRRTAWVIGNMLVASSGVLFSSLLPLNPIQLTLLVVSAFGAAAIGAFTNLPLTFGGGLLIGVFAALSTKWFTDGLLAGLPPSLPFLVLFVVLLVFPKRYLASRSVSLQAPRSLWTTPAPVQLVGAAALLVVLVFVPSFAGIHLTAWTSALATSIVFLSLSLLVRTSGQVSLGHISFAAIGAAAFSHLAVGQGLPWGIALVVAGLTAVPVGALLAIPSIRLTGLYLALATMGFGILLQGMFYTQDYMFGPNGLGLPMPRPRMGGLDLESDKGFYYLVLALVVAVAATIVLLNRSRLGRLLRTMAESPVSLETAGATVSVTRVLVFCLSAFLAALGGALAGVSATTVSGDSYQPLASLVYFTVIVVVVGGEPWNALLASAVLVLAPSYVDGDRVSTWLQLGFGLAAIAVSVLPTSLRGKPAPVRDLLDRGFRSRGTRAHAVEPVDAGQPHEAVSSVVKVEAGELTVSDLQIHFGGVLAVDGVSLQAPTGRITGLIGPNGAGKTTTFNACSGLLRPSSGEVAIDGRNVTRRGPAARARMGLGRTFQRMELADSLSVADNVAMGMEAGFAGSAPWWHMFSRRSERVRVQAAAREALELTGLTALADKQVGSLSTGQRRLVELARCLAGSGRILLLDEPSSGLDRIETERFAEVLKTVVARRGVGILLVEHDMALVLEVCEHIYVLDFGRPVFEGTAQEVAASDVVRAAYLGDAEKMAASGITEGSA